MAYRVYILYSKVLQRFYVGFTHLSIAERLKYHLSNHKGFTSRTKDWEIVYENEMDSKVSALTLEKAIKKRGAERYLEDLTK